MQVIPCSICRHLIYKVVPDRVIGCQTTAVNRERNNLGLVVDLERRGSSRRGSTSVLGGNVQRKVAIFLYILRPGDGYHASCRYSLIRCSERRCTAATQPVAIGIGVLGGEREYRIVILLA